MIGALIGAAASIGSSLLSKKSADKANQAANEHARRQEKLQKEFAQKGVRWKVNDAKKAGLHPLYALGANTVSYSPTQVGQSTPDWSGVADAGQNIGRAIDVTRSATGKAAAYEKTVQDLSVQRMGLENELLASQIAVTRQTGTSAGIPDGTDKYLIEGQGNAVVGPGLKETFERSPSREGFPAHEYGTVSDVGFSRTEGGGYALVPSKDAKDRMEDQWIPQIQWAIRNNVVPYLTGNHHKPPTPAKPGYFWSFNPFTGEYHQVSKKVHTRY